MRSNLLFKLTIPFALIIISNQSFSQTPKELTDTGITRLQCYKENSPLLVACNSDAAQKLNSRQDGMFGWDVSSPNSANGKLGFKYTKISNTGQKLPPSATSWECVRDETTGLTWEVKRNDGGLRDNYRTFTNYGDTRAGDVGVYISELNGLGLCGKTNWRMPTVTELQSILDYGTHAEVKIDVNFFPNTVSWVYWASTPSPTDPDIVTYMINFRTGDIEAYYRWNTNYLARLVSGN